MRSIAGEVWTPRARSGIRLWSQLAPIHGPIRL